MWSLIATVAGWVLSLFTGSTRKDEVALGKAQQRSADDETGLAAAERVQKAQGAPSGRAETVKDLRDGKF